MQQPPLFQLPSVPNHGFNLPYPNPVTYPLDRTPQGGGAARHNFPIGFPAMLSEYFERIVCINLEHREDRRSKVARQLEDSGLLAADKLTWFRAVRGEICPPPSFFLAGSGAWGCLLSHLRIVQDAIHDGIDSVLIIEDDLVVSPLGSEIVAAFMKQVPGDWGQLYLGGEHQADPQPIDHRPMVMRVANTNRTHAYALHSSAMKVFQKHICEFPDYAHRGPWHIDHQLGIAHEKQLWNTYCPAWWPFGQRGGESNISGNRNPDYWWHPARYYSLLPLIVAPSREAVAPSHRKHLFFRDLTTSTAGPSGAGPRPNDDSLTTALHDCAFRALERGLLPAVVGGNLEVAELSKRWNAGVIPCEIADIGKMISYPHNRLFRHPLNRNRSLPLEAFVRRVSTQAIP